MSRHSKLDQKKKKILFLATEIEPFLNLSSTARFIKELVETTDKTQEYEVRVIMPKFGLINERTNSIHEVQRLSGINVSVNNEEVSLVVKVGAIKRTKIQVYLLDNEYFFERKGVFHDNAGKFYTDNHSRIIFLNKSVISVLTYLRWNPHIIHAIGWPWALLPMYGKNSYKSSVALKKAKYIYTHNSSRFEPTISEQLLADVKDLKDGTKPSLETLYNIAATHADAITQLPEQNQSTEGQDNDPKKQLLEDFQTLYANLAAAQEQNITTSASSLQSV